MIILFVLEINKFIPLFIGSVKSVHLITWLRVIHTAGNPGYGVAQDMPCLQGLPPIVVPEICSN